MKGNEEPDMVAKKAVKEERVQINLQYGAPEYTEKKKGLKREVVKILGKGKGS